MTSVSKRKVEDYMLKSNDVKLTEGIGPGTYSPKQFDKSAAYQNVRPAPFLTQDQKWSPDKTAIKNNMPGPGAYNISGDLNKGKVIAINPERGKDPF